jgi:hypothetical protein
MRLMEHQRGVLGRWHSSTTFVGHDGEEDRFGCTGARKNGPGI